MDLSTNRNLMRMLEARGITSYDPDSYPILIFLLLKAFLWMDTTLQENRAERGEDRLSRNESHVMLVVAMGIRRPIEVAKSLSVSRQALNVTINLLKDRKLIALEPDPDDRRCKIIVFAESGQSTRDSAVEIFVRAEKVLERRIGQGNMSSLYKALLTDWGVTPLFDVPASATKQP